MSPQPFAPSSFAHRICCTKSDRYSNKSKFLLFFSYGREAVKAQRGGSVRVAKSNKYLTWTFQTMPKDFLNNTIVLKSPEEDILDPNVCQNLPFHKGTSRRWSARLSLAVFFKACKKKSLSCWLLVLYIPAEIWQKS